METNLKLGLIKFNTLTDKLILLYVNENETQFKDIVLADMLDSPLKDDYALVQAYYKNFKQDETTTEEHLQGFNYALKSLLSGGTIAVGVDKENNKTVVSIFDAKNENNKTVNTYAVVDPFATLCNAVLDYNVKRRKEEIAKIDDGEYSK